MLITLWFRQRAHLGVRKPFDDDEEAEVEEEDDWDDDDGGDGDIKDFFLGNSSPCTSLSCDVNLTSSFIATSIKTFFKSTFADSKLLVSTSFQTL